MRAYAPPTREDTHSARSRPFDASPVPGTSPDDLDLDRFGTELLPQLVAPDVLAANRRTSQQQLAALRFSSPDGRVTPTGLLVSGVDPLEWLPGASVQFLRIEGTTLDGDVLSAHRLANPLPDLIRELEETLRAHVDTQVSFTGSRTEQRRANIPFEAVQQIVRNVVMHRTYAATNAPARITWFDDRVEVLSPGGPYGLVSIDTFGQPGVTDYRTPTIAGVLAQLGFVQRFGVGIETARARLRTNGNPPLELQATSTFVNAVMGFL